MEKSLRSPILPPIPKMNPEPNTKAKHILLTPIKLEPSPNLKLSIPNQNPKTTNNIKPLIYSIQRILNIKNKVTPKINEKLNIKQDHKNK